MRFPTNSTDTHFSIPFGDPDPNARFKRHAGIDINVPTGTDVFAPVSGVVTAYTAGVFHGQVIEIRGDDGLFYHMLHNSKLLVNPGSRVTEGQLVAKSGATGQGITGAHVHYGIAKKSLPNVTDFSDFIDPNSVKGESVSKVDKELAGRLLTAYFTPEQIQAEGGDKFVSSWVGTESNAMINALFESPQFRNKRLDAEHNAKLVKDGVGDFEPVAEQLYKKKG